MFMWTKRAPIFSLFRWIFTAHSHSPYQKKQGVFWGMSVIRTSLLVPIAFFEGHHPGSSKWKYICSKMFIPKRSKSLKRNISFHRCHFAPLQRQFDGEAAGSVGGQTRTPIPLVGTGVGMPKLRWPCFVTGKRW